VLLGPPDLTPEIGRDGLCQSDRPLRRCQDQHRSTPPCPRETRTPGAVPHRTLHDAVGLPATRLEVIADRLVPFVLNAADTYIIRVETNASPTNTSTLAETMGEYTLTLQRN
jgi:hypothetical protein